MSEAGLISSCGSNAAHTWPLGGAKGAELESAALCSSSLDSKGKQTCFRQTSPLMNDLHKDAPDWKRKESQPWKSRDKQTRVSSSEEKNRVNRVILVFTRNNGGRACACLGYFSYFRFHTTCSRKTNGSWRSSLKVGIKGLVSTGSTVTINIT